MALTAYLTLEGQKQGAIQGDCTQTKDNQKDSILVYGVDYVVDIATDPKTGQPTAQRVHHPFIITKKTDPATPLIYQACTSGEKMKKWVLEYYNIDDQGGQEKFYTVELENSVVVKVHHKKINTMDENNLKFYDMEEVFFSFSKITWTHETSSKTAEDDWSTPK